MRLLFVLASRALLRNRLSFALLVAAVTAGVGFQIPNTANLNGYTQELLRKGVARSTGHVQISSGGTEPIDGARRLVDTVRRLPFVRGVIRRLVHAGVAFKGTRHLPVRVVGVDPSAEGAGAGVCHRLARGACPAPGRTDQLVLGHGLAQQLRLSPGDRLKLVLPYENLGEVEYSSAWYKVVGVVQSGGDFSSDSDLFVEITLLQRLLGHDDAASALHVYVDDHTRAAEYAAVIARETGARGGAPGGRAGQPPRVQPWWEVSEFVANAIAGNRAISFISLAMVVLAVMIPVWALLHILVLHERRPIAILGALGFERRAIFCIYLFKAALIGVVGVALGVGVGLVLCAFFRAYPIFAHSGFVVRPELSVWGVLVPSAVLFGVSLLAGLVPAFLAARCNPSLELREE